MPRMVLCNTCGAMFPSVLPTEEENDMQGYGCSGILDDSHTIFVAHGSRLYKNYLLEVSPVVSPLKLKKGLICDVCISTALEAGGYVMDIATAAT